MKSKRDIRKEIELPEGVNVEFVDYVLNVTGPKGSISKKVATKIIVIEVKDGKVLFSPRVNKTKREKAMINTYSSILSNMIQGVQEPFEYKLKICSSHFPMTVKVNGDVVEVSNFIGERVSRTVKVKEGVDVKVDAQIITVSSIDKEKAGQVAADIEKLTKRSAFDKRIFQDGIYMIEKAGVELKWML